MERRLPPSVPPRAAVLVVLILASAGTFAAIAEEVRERETSDFDRSLALAIHRLDTPFLDFTMRLFTEVGSVRVVAVALVATVFWAFRRGDRRAGWTLLAVSLASEGVNSVLKNFFERARPTLFEEIATLHTYSFPSGHAMTAAAVYGTIGAVLMLTREHPRLRATVGIATPLLVILIGLSRVFLGVHWPTDVVAGWAAGMTLMLVAFAVLVLPAHAGSRPGRR